MKPELYTGLVIVGLAASGLAGCASDDDDAAASDQTMQLLDYTCREDGTRSSTPPDIDPAASWRDMSRTVGVAVSAARLEDPAYRATVAAQFNQLTPENEMKWETIEPAPGEFDFSAADTIVAFARDNGMKVRGHTLVWHSQLAPWVEELTDEQAVREAMTRHIQTVVTHFRDNFPGVVIAWDVVNEAMNVMQGPMGGTAIYRDSIFSRLLGEGFIAEAFQIAHEADPDVLLYYNDFGVESTTGAKSVGTYDMVNGLVQAGVPINGMGFQMHTGPLDQGPNADDFAANVARYAALGLQVDVTEMDVSLCAVGGNSLGLELQRYRYNRIVSACLSSPSCRSISLWGLGDANSWLNDTGCTQGTLVLDTLPAPLAFDDAYGRKAAWFGVYDALAGCTYP